VIEVGTNPGTDVTFADNRKAIFGAGSDLQIYHDGSDSYIKEDGTGNLIVAADDFRVTNVAVSETMIGADTDGVVTLYHNGSSKLTTTATGIDVTGDVNSDSVTTGTFTSTGIDDNATSTAITIDSSENVGINTTPALAGGVLSIEQGSGTHAIVANSNTSSAPSIYLRSIGGTATESHITFNDSTALLFTTTSTERMRIDASGNVGIGTTSPANKLDVNGILQSSSVGNYLQLQQSSTEGYINMTGSGGLNFRMGSGFDTRMTIDSSGNVGIGVLSPTEKLHISGNALVGGEVESVASGTTTGFKWGQDTSTHYWKWAEFNNQTASLQENSTASGSSRIAIAAGGNVGIGTASPTGLLTLGTGTFSAAAANTSALYTSTTAGLVAVADGLLLVDRAGADVFKVDSSGNLLVGTTSQINSTKTGISASSTTNCLGLQNANNNNYFITALNSSSTEVFRVAGDGDVVNTNNSYGALSDERLKSNIVDASSQIDDIMAVQVRSYTLNETGDRHIGVVAQELEASGMSGLVKTDDEGIKSVKYSVLYMKAIKALQEAVTRIETLEAEVAALKGA
jgi:hypothetical protein